MILPEGVTIPDEVTLVILEGEQSTHDAVVVRRLPPLIALRFTKTSSTAPTPKPTLRRVEKYIVESGQKSDRYDAVSMIEQESLPTP